jgi:hypothetical protein
MSVDWWWGFKEREKTIDKKELEEFLVRYKKKMLLIFKKAKIPLESKEFENLYKFYIEQYLKLFLWDHLDNEDSLKMLCDEKDYQIILDIPEYFFDTENIFDRDNINKDDLKKKNYLIVYLGDNKDNIIFLEKKDLWVKVEFIKNIVKKYVPIPAPIPQPAHVWLPLNK